MSAGSCLGGRYTLERRLGAGGMASVWLADDGRLARRVAVKLIADTLASDQHYRTRFSREARAAASVSHPNIVPVYDYGLHGERPFLVMEYVPGGSLADVFAGRQEILPGPAGLAGELLGALACVHAAGLVHRDVKPANILLDAAGHARLTDFGIAQPEDAASLTQTGMVVGSIRYLAPEVAAGARATAAADLYAAGVVLRELTDRTPAPELSPLIEALTAQRPGDRPESADAALRLLAAPPAAAAAAAANETVEATEPTRIAPPRPSPGSAVRRPPRVRRQLGGAPAQPPRAPRRPPRPVRTAPDDRPGPPTLRIPARALAAAVVVLVVAVVLIAARGGGSPGAPAASTTRPTASTTPATTASITKPAASATGAVASTTTSAAVQPASAGAPLADQLSSLRRIVAAAAKP